MTLDLHVTYDATGSADTLVTEAATGTIPAGDGATTIGLSPQANAILCSYGVNSLNGAAQGLVKLGLSGNNLPDPVNGSNMVFTGTDVGASRFVMAQYPYTAGTNLVNYAQEAAGIIAAVKLDWVPGPAGVAGDWVPVNNNIYPTTSAAVTAGVYKTTAFNPTQTPTIGKYAILGAWVGSLTAGAVIRFQHSDFKGIFPGFPVVDYSTGSLTPAQMQGAGFFDPQVQGYQFVWMSSLLRQPCCPVFNIQGQSTGLNMQILDTTADTPTIQLNLMQIG